MYSSAVIKNVAITNVLEFFWMDMMGKPIVVISGADLLDEVCDETRFDKSTRGNPWINAINLASLAFSAAPIPEPVTLVLSRILMVVSAVALEMHSRTKLVLLLSSNC